MWPLARFGETSWQSLRLAARGLRRAPAFSAAAAFTLALGIAGTIVMFTLVEGVLLRPFPLRDEGRLVVAWKESPAGQLTHWPFDARDLDALERESRVLARVTGVSYYGAGPGVVVENGRPVYLKRAAVSGAFFEVLGVEPLLGRGLQPDDDRTGADNVLVITHSLWRGRYAGASDVIGRRLTIEGQPFTIVGVMPPDVVYPRGVEAWLTLAAEASTQSNPAFRAGILRDVDLLARLRPGTTFDQARSELTGFVTRLEAGLTPDAPRGLRPVVRSFAEVVAGDVRPALLALSAAVGLVLLIASANVANLLLLRGEVRRPELSIRAALGAGRGRLATELLAESLLLATVAGVAGLVLSHWLLPTVTALVPGGLPRIDAIRVDPLVVAFALGVSGLAALLAGVAPALFATRLDVAAELRAGRQAGSTRVARRGRQALVVAQVALAVTVVAAAGLLARSLAWLETVDRGLLADRLVFVELAALGRADEARPLPRFLDGVVARLASTPGIEGATPVNTPPFAGTGGWDLPVFTAEGQDLAGSEKNPGLNLESVHPGYFATFGVPVRGRAFTADDRAGALEVAIVSDDLADRLWPGQDPIGKRLKFGRPDSQESWRTVVGVARSTRYRELAEPRPTLYLPAPQFMVAATMLAVRTTLPISRLAEIARGAVAAEDPERQVARLSSFADLARAPLARPRFSAFLISAFGIAALLLAAVGLYAVMAAHVRQRYPEIGVRVAMGATASDLRRLVLGEGLRLSSIGAAIGLLGAAGASRVLQALLFGVRPLDSISILGAVVLLLATSALACYLPARRATRLDPLVVLRTL